jgi:hypothetical protein
VDAHGKSLPDRHVGEVALQSDCMLTGYYHRQDATEKAFKDGWYLTGDFGYLVDGELYITGRKKDLIIVGGKNIYPQDLELLAYEVPGVHTGRASAFGVFNDATGTEDVVLAAEVDTDDPAERQRIADGIRAAVTRGSAVALRYVHIVGRGWMVKTSSGRGFRGRKETAVKSVSWLGDHDTTEPSFHILLEGRQFRFDLIVTAFFVPQEACTIKWQIHDHFYYCVVGGLQLMCSYLHLLSYTLS